MGREEDVFLRKIDIGNWQTAVTAQYKVPSIPSFWVFGRDMQQIGKPTSSLETVVGLIRRAR